MSETLDSLFPLVIIRAAIRVTNKAFRINHGEGEYFAVWAECYNAEEIGTSYVPPAYLTVLDRNGYMVRDYAVEKEVKLAAMRFRVRQIQEEYDITSEVTDLNLITRILDRVWAGEWMGQFNEGRCIYLSELCDILNLPMIEIWHVVDDLISENHAAFIGNSHILEAPAR